MAAKFAFKSWFSNRLEWLNLVLLLLTLGIAVRSIEQSRWISPQPPLVLILILAVLTGAVFAKSRLPVIATYLLSVVLGGIVSVWQVSRLLPPMEVAPDTNRLIVMLQSLWQTINLSKPSQNTVHFAIFLVLLTWAIGYVSTWFAVRQKNPWVAVLFGATAILVNLRHVTEEYYIFFLLYLLAGLILLAQTSLVGQHSWLKRNSSRYYPVRGVLSFVISVILLSLLMVTSTWFVPQVRAEQFQAFVSTKMPLNRLGESRFNVFASVPAKQLTLTSTEQETLPPVMVLNQGGDVLFTITSPKRIFYWRTRCYNLYYSWGWTSEPPDEQASNRGTQLPKAQPSSKHQEMTYTVVNKLNTNVVLIAGEFLSSNIPVRLQTIGANSAVPDTIAITTPRMLNYGESYTVTSHLNAVTPEELSQAGEKYPRDITDHYLQLPSALPSRIIQISRNIVAGAKTSFAKVKAIRNFLFQFAYDEAGAIPSEGADPVGHFLIIEKSGNCNNFASAMVVMLRSVGVPSRLVTGYLAREWDESERTATIRANDYHAWAEVYFPGYGWIEFEATPIVNRDNPDGKLAGNVAGDTGFNGQNNRAGASDLTSPDDLTGSTGDNDTTAIAGDILEDTTRTAESAVSTLSQPWVKLLFAAFGLLFFLFLLMFVFYQGQLRWRGGDDATKVYARMCFLASLVRLRPKPQQTPSEYGARLALAFPAQTEAIRTITHAYLVNRFSSRKESGLQERERLKQSWQIVLRAFLKRLFRR